MLDRLGAMRVFAKAAEVKGFAEAARSLRMSPPAVTRAIASLEDAIGARLFVRTTRSIRLTDAGSRYLEDCRRILADVTAAEAVAAGSYATPSGRLVVTAPVLFGRIHVLPVLTRFLTQYPGVTAQALFLDRTVSLVEEGIDVAVRIGHLSDSEMSAVRVGSVSRVVCAAPSYLERHPEPKTPADLAGHTIIALSNSGTSRDWRFGRDGRISVPVRPRLFCNLNDAAIGAAIDGWGVTRVLSYQVGTAFRDGRLRRLLVDFEEAPLPIHILHPGGRAPSATIRSFVDHAARALRANEMLGGPGPRSADRDVEV